jgi:hypothetical protein
MTAQDKTPGQRNDFTHGDTGLIDPETERQIAELARDTRPLLVLDVDDVVLDFVKPFPRYLVSSGYELDLATFRLHGNVRHLESGRIAEREEVARLIDDFFRLQAEWQTVTKGAGEAIAYFAGKAEIVMLTAMPHKWRAIRRAHLDTLGLGHPLLTTEMAKGPALARLRGESGRPIAFVDDQPANHVSARQHVPDAHLFHLMAENALRALLPAPPEGVTVVDDWHEATPLIARALGLD